MCLRLILEPERPRTGLFTARENLRDKAESAQRHSSCLLWLQIGSVECDSFFPNGPCDHSNLPRQREARHLWPHPFGQESLIKFRERTFVGRTLDRRALE